MYHKTLKRYVKIIIEILTCLYFSWRFFTFMYALWVLPLGLLCYYDASRTFWWCLNFFFGWLWWLWVVRNWAFWGSSYWPREIISRVSQSHDSVNDILKLSWCPDILMISTLYPNPKFLKGLVKVKSQQQFLPQITYLITQRVNKGIVTIDSNIKNWLRKRRTNNRP